MPRLTASKTEILEAAGYAYSFDRQVYLNRKTRKAFSVEFVQDHNEEEIRSSVRGNHGGAEWQFYFNSPPSEAVRHELELVLG